MRSKISRFRYIFCLSFTSIVFLGFLYKLIDWQIFNGENLRLRANSKNTYAELIKFARGEILDVNGIDFAVNDIVYQVSLDRFKFKEEESNDNINFLLDLFEKRNEKWEDDLPIDISSDGNYSFLEDKPKENKIKSEISKLKSFDVLNLNDYATAEECISKLFEKYKISDKYGLKRKRNIASVRYGMIKKGFETFRSKSYVFAQKVSREMIIIISELSKKNPLFKITSEPKRGCKNGSLLPHIIGYVGKLDKEDYEKLKNKGYWLDDIIGRDGIERKFENELRGKDGKKIIETDENGEIISQSIIKEVEHGHTVFLTIDAKIQKVMNESLEKNAAESNGIKSGGAVMLDLRDNSIIAASTYPSYDLSRYNEDNDYYNLIAGNNVGKPLLNRAFDASFEPGSSLKPLTALAALKEGAIDPNSIVRCRGYWSFPGGGLYLRCMGHHGDVGLLRALSESCNAFFLDTAHKLQERKLAEYAKKFGLGIKTGIELSETEGCLPTPEDAKSIGGEWFPASRAQAGMGQASNLYSPLQLATYVGTIANNGKRFRPHLIRKITDYSRTNVIFENDPKKPELVEQVDIPQEYFDIVKKAMRQASITGTAGTPFRNYAIPIASKTGTAQNSAGKHCDHKIYIGFAPFDNPEVALAVILPEAGDPTHLYKYVAKDTFDAYFKGVGKDAKFE